MKRLLAIFAMVAVLSPPLVAVANDQAIPNGIQRIGAANVAGTPLDYSDVNVAVVDTGIDPSHPDLNVVGGVDCTSAMSAGFPPSFAAAYVEGDFAPIALDPQAPGWADGMGHGTHVAGIIGAKDNDLGVVGVAPNASLWAVRVLDSGGGGTMDTINCGLEWIATTHERTDISVVNMSLGGSAGGDVRQMIRSCDYTEYPAGPIDYPYPYPDLERNDLQEAICDLRDLGITVVVAAGNSDEDASGLVPAGMDGVLTVSNFSDFDGLPGGLEPTTACPEIGGTDDTLWTHWNGSPEQGMSSAWGATIEFAAPGTCILSTMPGNWGAHGGGYGTATGTSMAAPHVAGVAARYIGDSGVRNVYMVREALEDAAEPQTPAFFDADPYAEKIIRVVG